MRMQINQFNKSIYAVFVKKELRLQSIYNTKLISISPLYGVPAAVCIYAILSYFFMFYWCAELLRFYRHTVAHGKTFNHRKILLNWYQYFFVNPVIVNVLIMCLLEIIAGFSTIFVVSSWICIPLFTVFHLQTDCRCSMTVATMKKSSAVKMRLLQI